MCQVHKTLALAVELMAPMRMVYRGTTLALMALVIPGAVTPGANRAWGALHQVVKCTSGLSELGQVERGGAMSVQA